jgi:hypothetical protein
MASTPARDPVKSSMDPASANKECPKLCSRFFTLRFFRAAQENLQGAAMRSSAAAGPLRDFYEALLAKGGGQQWRVFWAKLSCCHRRYGRRDDRRSSLLKLPRTRFWMASTRQTRQNRRIGGLFMNANDKARRTRSGFAGTDSMGCQQRRCCRLRSQLSP